MSKDEGRAEGRIQVCIRLSARELETLREVGRSTWPHMPLSAAQTVKHLALWKADELTKEADKKPRK